MKCTPAGELSERIEFQAPVDTPGPAGGYAKGWTHHGFAWAKVTPVRGDESDRQGALRNVNRHMFEIRRDLSITGLMRIVWLGEPFNIIEVRRTASRELTMTIIADQGVTQ